MAQFKHPNVVHLFGSVVDGDSVSFVCEREKELIFQIMKYI